MNNALLIIKYFPNWIDPVLSIVLDNKDFYRDAIFMLLADDGEVIKRETLEQFLIDK